MALSGDVKRHGTMPYESLPSSIGGYGHTRHAQNITEQRRELPCLFTCMMMPSSLGPIDIKDTRFGRFWNVMQWTVIPVSRPRTFQEGSKNFTTFAWRHQR